MFLINKIHDNVPSYRINGTAYVIIAVFLINFVFSIFD